MLFPFVLCIFVAVRQYLLPKIFANHELEAVSCVFVDVPRDMHCLGVCNTERMFERHGYQIQLVYP